MGSNDSVSRCGATVVLPIAGALSARMFRTSGPRVAREEEPSAG